MDAEQLKETEPTELSEQPSEQDIKFQDKLLKDFGPMALEQFVGEPVLEYQSFD